MTLKDRNNYIAVLIVILILALMSVMSGCSTTTVNRTVGGGLDVKHTTWFIRTEAPSLVVERDDKNTYNASFNADSRGGNVEAMAGALELLMALSKGTAPVTE
ncbi:hypothetical protein N9937_01285 [bacterium]|nr:hypothetical protein [bacterium]